MLHSHVTQGYFSISSDYQLNALIAVAHVEVPPPAQRLAFLLALTCKTSTAATVLQFPYLLLNCITLILLQIFLLIFIIYFYYLYPL